MYKIKLSKNKEALVDVHTYSWANRFKWHLYKGGYAVRKKGNKTIYLHRCVVHAEEDEYVDHINGNPLDNRLENLRICLHSDNMKNQKTRNNKSGYKGVRLHKSGLWQARIHVDKKEISLGYYKTPEDAARAYDSASSMYHGKFGRPNFYEPAKILGVE